MSWSENYPSCSAIILSGGRNSRMAGRNKAFVKVGERAILDRIMGVLTPIFREIILVTRHPELYENYGFKIVEDIFQHRASLTGIHAGLVHSQSMYAFVVPCDAPFLKPGVVLKLIEHVDPSLDAIVPASEDYYQPLCAIYSKRCIRHIEEHLQRKDYKIINIFNEIQLKTIPMDDFRSIDPDLCSFFNVNTPEALNESQEMARRLADTTTR